MVLVLLVGLLPAAALAEPDAGPIPISEWDPDNPVELDSWEALAEAMSQSGFYRLTQDLKLPTPVETGQAALTVPEGVIILLDLNGKKLDCDYGVADDTDTTFVTVEVHGLLGVGDTSDSVGGIEGADIGVHVIKDTEAPEDGGFLMYGGTVDASLRGIWVAPGGNFGLFGGTVHSDSIGIDVREGGSVIVQGDSEIRGNTSASNN